MSEKRTDMKPGNSIEFIVYSCMCTSVSNANLKKSWAHIFILVVSGSRSGRTTLSGDSRETGCKSIIEAIINNRKLSCSTKRMRNEGTG